MKKISYNLKLYSCLLKKFKNLFWIDYARDALTFIYIEHPNFNLNTLQIKHVKNI
jgi:hypothetical protein